jgi:hypothetical protein
MAIFEVIKAALLNIQVFWNVVTHVGIYHWTRRNAPEDFNIQVLQCGFLLLET